MTAHIPSPVEALQREIDDSVNKPMNMREFGIYRAAFELALETNCMLQTEGAHMTWCDTTMVTFGRRRACDCGADDARVKLAKLVEALK